MIDESKWLYRIKRLENYLVTLKKKSGFYSILRFSFFIVIIAGIVMAGNMGQSIGGWLAFAALIAFIFAVMGHGKIKAKIKDCEHEILVYTAAGEISLKRVMNLLRIRMLPCWILI